MRGIDNLLGSSFAQQHERDTEPAPQPNRAERRAREQHKKAKNRRYDRASARYEREQERKKR